MWYTARRLDWALRTRGPDLHAWPERERVAALALLRRSPVARQALADALAAEDAPVPDTAGRCRMQAVIRAALLPASPVERGIRWTALAACVAAGLYLGLPPVETITSDILSTIEATSPAPVFAALQP